MATPITPLGAAGAGSAPGASPPFRSTAIERLGLAGILFGAFLVFAVSLRYQFVYDDDFQIVRNPHIQSWKYVSLYFTSHLWSQDFPVTPGWNYRPLFLLWLRLNYAVFGPRPAGWHLTTLTAHLAATALVYLVARRLSRDPWLAALAAIVFGFHPVHIEAVAWVSGVSEPLCAALLLLSFLLYLRRRENQHWAWTAGSLAVFALAVISKETAIVLPFIVFVHAWLFPAVVGASANLWQRFVDATRAAIPYVAVAIALGAARWVVLHGPGKPLTEMPWTWVVLTAPSLLVFYARLLIFPVGLSAFYDLPYITHIELRSVVLASLLLLLVAVALWRWSRRSPLVAFASLWMILTLAPALDVMYFTVGEPAHDRYLYLPSVGFSLLVALAVREFRGGKRRLAGRSPAQVIAAALLTLVLGIGVVLQERHWVSDFTLYQWGVQRAPGNIFARRSYAGLLEQQGRVNEAVRQYQEVLDRYPNDGASIDELGWINYQTGRLKEADDYLGQAVELQPQNAAAVLYLGLTRMKLGKLDDAATLVRRAVQMQPQAPGYHFALGTILEMQGNLRDALEEFRAELTVSPQQVRAREAIGRIEARQRKGK